MANLDFQDVLIISGVATLGFTLLSFGYSAYMAKHGHTYQMKAKAPPKAKP